MDTSSTSAELRVGETARPLPMTAVDWEDDYSDTILVEEVDDNDINGNIHEENNNLNIYQPNYVHHVRDRTSEAIMIENLAAESIQAAYWRYRERIAKFNRVVSTDKLVMELAAETIKYNMIR